MASRRRHRQEHRRLRLGSRSFRLDRCAEDVMPDLAPPKRFDGDRRSAFLPLDLDQ
jgi:hypothetical protein